jgi:Fic family protein
MSNLHSQLASLASSFANAVLEAIRGASLEDLLSESRAPSKARREQSNGTPKPARARSSARLKRRSPEDIAGALDKVVALVKKNKNGLRAEQIRDQLGMQAKEMPRVLKEGLSKKQLKSRGQKRATTYFSA